MQESCMSKRTYREYNPQQSLLFPSSLAECLPSGHIAFFIDEVVEGLDLSSIYRDYDNNDGKGARHMSQGVC